LKLTFSNYISSTLNRKYSFLAKIFLKLYGVTIKKHISIIKIERIKELIKNDSLNMSEISDKMHYSSLSHLSLQFKQITKMTPLEFRKYCVQLKIDVKR
jgi:AraC-like DNA-binding protein